MGSGKLSFKQDLLYSKVTTTSKIPEAFTKISRQHSEGYYGRSYVQTYISLLRCEIFNRTITSHILETLGAVFFF
jgi:hypothetical protein